jgi:hypothetical protein
MMTALQLGRLGQEVVKVAAPPGRVLAIAETFGFGSVQHFIDPAA